MAVSHTCFLEMAKESLEKSGEIRTRNAISRAYYALYHSALRMTDKLTPTHTLAGDERPGGAHMRFYTACCDGEAAVIKNLDVEKVKVIGIKLKMLHAQRVIADYRLEKKVNRITALSVIKDVEDTNSIIDNLLNKDSE